MAVVVGLRSMGWGERDGRKQTMTEVIVRFGDVPPGPPTSWVPPCLSPSPVPASSELKWPTSLWKGEGWLRLILTCEGAVALVVKLTSLNRGEGIMAGFLGMVVGELRWGRWWWW